MIPKFLSAIGVFAETQKTQNFEVQRNFKETQKETVGMPQNGAFSRSAHSKAKRKLIIKLK